MNTATHSTRSRAWSSERPGPGSAGTIHNVEKTLDAMALRPFELHLELTNLCNANCIFCPYQYQERATGFMSDAGL